MLGLINRSFQFFRRDTYGVSLWDAVARQVGISPSGFESMLTDDDAVTDQLIDAASTLLRRPRESLMEDMGTYLVSYEKLGTGSPWLALRVCWPIRRGPTLDRCCPKPHTSRRRRSR